ncbi:MAG: Uma2 family endonuclease [Gemmataceae bacterium]
MPTAHETVADLLELIDQLGGVPPSRVILKPLPGTATEEDLIRRQRRTGRLYELVDGTLVEKTMGYNEGSIATEISMHLRLYAKKHKLGNVAGADATMRLMPKLVRIPDVSFVRREKLPGGHLPDAPIPDLVPDLAVEVLSESNTPGEMQRKLKEYFLTGTSLVWIVDPDKRLVTVHTAPDVFTVLTEKDALQGGDLLPGFTLPVASLFEDLPPPKKRPSSRKKKP